MASWRKFKLPLPFHPSPPSQHNPPSILHQGPEPFSQPFSLACHSIGVILYAPYTPVSSEPCHLAPSSSPPLSSLPATPSSVASLRLATSHPSTRLPCSQLLFHLLPVWLWAVAFSRRSLSPTGPSVCDRSTGGEGQGGDHTGKATDNRVSPPAAPHEGKVRC